MRRLKSRRRKKNNKKMFIIIFIISIFFVCSTGYALLSQKLNIKGIVRLNTSNEECDIHKFNGYKKFEHEITYEIYDTNNGYKVHAMIKITNIGEKYINRWRSYLILPENSVINDSYNCNRVFEGDAYIFENPSENYNNIIEAGSSISYDVAYTSPTSDYQIIDVASYGFDSNIEVFPTIADMSQCLNGGEPSVPDEEKYITVTANDNQKWGDTMITTNTTLTISNSSNEDVEYWYVIIDVGEKGSIPGCWSATCSQSGTQVKITQPSWRAIIPANGSISIDFQITVPSGYEYKIIESGILF